MASSCVMPSRLYCRPGENRTGKIAGWIQRRAVHCPWKSFAAAQPLISTAVAAFQMAIHWRPCREPRRKSRLLVLHEPHEFRVRARIESGGGPPHSKTLSRWPQSLELTRRFPPLERMPAVHWQEWKSASPTRVHPHSSSHLEGSSFSAVGSARGHHSIQL